MTNDRDGSSTSGSRYTAVEDDSHALVRMRERKIAEAQVERALDNPTRVSPSALYPDRMVAEYDTAAGNTLRVVDVEQRRATGTVAYVVTVIRSARSRT